MVVRLLINENENEHEHEPDHDKKVIPMSVHAKYGGSTAARTLACPAWQKLSEGIPESPASYPAQLGTALHEVLEACLRDPDCNPFDAAGTIVEGIKITTEHITTKIYPALDAFEDLMDAYDIDQYWSEEWVARAEDVAGTADYIGLSADGKTVVFADYKSGDGIIVDARENKQGLFYAMCGRSTQFAKYMKNAERLVIAIIQPSDRREEYLDIWETDLATLDVFTAQHDAAVIASERGDGEPVVGSHCDWCPAEATCPAKKELVAAAEGFNPVELIATELSQALEIAEHIEGWVKAVRKKSHELLEQGAEIKGYKLVNKRATRVWNDTPALEDMIKLSRKLKKADAYDVKLKTPAQLEKACAANGVDFERFAPFISRVSSGTTLVGAHDKREAVLFSSTQKMLAERFAQ